MPARSRLSNKAETTGMRELWEATSNPRQAGDDETNQRILVVHEQGRYKSILVRSFYSMCHIDWLPITAVARAPQFPRHPSRILYVLDT